MAIQAQFGVLETMIREGDFVAARRALREINPRKLGREYVASYANLAARLDLNPLAVKALNPIVRARRPRAAASTAAERIAYAASLRNLGMVSEAASILIEETAPVASFQLALCHIHEWRYAEAIPLLEGYVRSFAEPGYPMQVGKVNLLAALIHEERMREIPPLLAELRRDLDPEANTLLYRSTLRLAAQFEIAKENWDRALVCLADAGRSLEHAPDSLYSLLVAKWQAIAGARKKGRVTEELLAVRAQAARVRHWETLRDCDFHLAWIARDGKALTRLYFGTPFASYRAKIAFLLGAEVPAQYLWRGDQKGPARVVFDLARARAGKSALEPGQALHRLLIILCEDFYRPLSLWPIFSKLFPDEEFNPGTSEPRVRQVMLRLRQWLRAEALPLRLDESAGSYVLRFTGSLAIAIPRERLPLETRELQLVQLLAGLGRAEFTSKDAMRATGDSKSGAKRLLKWAVEAGQLEREGWGPSAIYRPKRT